MERKEHLDILTVCGLGFGTSLIMKYGIDDVISEAGIKNVHVEAGDLGTAKSTNKDLIVAADDMVENLQGAKAPVVYLNSMTNKEEMRKKVLPVVKEMLGLP